MSNAITCTIDADGLATVVIDLPEKSMNVLSQSLTTELAETINKIAEDDAIKGAIITSGKKDFVAGGDLQELYSAAISADISKADLKEALTSFPKALRKLETCGKPVVAAINGTALGGGLEITLACHHRIVSDNSAIKLGLPEAQIGLLPGGGGTQRLPRLLGVQAALPMLLSGIPVAPAKALKIGLVHGVVPAEELLEEAKRWLRESPNHTQPWDNKWFRCKGTANPMETFFAGNGMLQKSTMHNYPAMKAIASCVYEGAPLAIDAGLEIEALYFTSLFYDPVAGNMIRSLFLHKQAADKLSARPEHVAKHTFTIVGILGAGVMGAGIAYEAARSGCTVLLLDRDMDAANKGKAYSEKILSKKLERGKISQEKADALLERIKPVCDYSGLAACDLVVEAVFEDPKIKGDVIAKAEAVLPEGAIFASNTSTLRISMLSEQSSRPKNFIGLHFFSPVDRMPLVEVIRGKETSEETLAIALDFVQKISKTPIIVNDAWGFYTSRCFGTFTDEGMSMLEEGVKPALIENAARQCGMPVGPLAMQDGVSQELSYSIISALKKMMGDKFQTSAADRVNTKMVEGEGRKGRKHGEGFYSYPTDGSKHIWEGLATIYPLADEQPDVTELKKRILYRQALETARCLDEGVLETPADGDIGALFGWGFPQYTGGPVALIDTVGVETFVKECDAFAEKLGDRFTVPALLRDMAKSGQSFYGA